MDVVTRLAALLVAILLALDAFSGERTQTLRVDRHTHATSWRQDDGYRLHFVGGRVDSCEVGWSAFNALADGDEVAVDSSRVFKSCDAIRRGGDVISESHARKWFMPLPIAILLAAAFGWIQFERRPGGHARGWWFG